MTFRHFQIFVSVCDCKNMTAAAARLYMSQSAVSQTISELERHYETRLFERLGKKLYLTHAGDLLSSYARHILRMNLDAEHDMRNLSRSGSLRIGASVTIAATLLPALVTALRREQPGMHLSLTEENTQRLEQMLLSDQLDLALAEGEPESPHLLQKPFAEDALLLVCGATHPLAAQGRVQAADLSAQDFILREQGSGTRSCFIRAMEAQNIRWHSSWTCSNTESIKNALMEGLGLSALSARTVQRELREGTLCQLEVENLHFPRQFKLLYHKNKYLTQAMQQLIRLCSRLEAPMVQAVEDLPS